MSWLRRIVAMGCVGLACGSGLQAQSRSPAVPEGPVLERALQQADGPRRRILEAARVKPSGAAVPARPREVASVMTLSAAPPPLALEPPVPMPGVAVASAIEAPAPAALPGDMPVAPAPVLEPLKLLTLVEPSLPDRLWRRLGTRAEYQVELRVGEDGRVLHVLVRPPVLPEVATRIEEAVRQWRYAPQPVERSHLVTLVLNPG